MIWGKTFLQKRDWYKWFAWYPVQLDTHQMAWLEYVYRRDYHRESIFKQIQKERT